MRKFSDYVEAMDQRGNLEVDRDDFNAEMFPEPFKPAMRASQVDEIPPNYLKDSATYRLILKYARSALSDLVSHVDAMREEQGGDVPMDRRVAFLKAIDLEKAVRLAVLSLPALDKGYYSGGNQPTLSSKGFAEFYRHSDALKAISSSEKGKGEGVSGSTPYDKLAYAMSLLSQLLEEYRRSGYGHKVISTKNKLPG